jgi:4-hydroxy-2-oxoheptanedioate aldolase
MLDSHDTTEKSLREKVLGGDTTFGCWLILGSSITAELIGDAGFDWVLIDLEHGAGTETAALHQLEALGATPAAPLVRVESPSRIRANRVLDLGAEGVMFPRIETAQDAREAAAWLKYPPEGTRGVAGNVRAARCGVDFDRYKVWAADGILGIVQIETEAVLGCLNEVAAIDGVDVLFVGPNDLSASLGIHGQWDHRRYLEALDAVVASCRTYGKAPGILLRRPEDLAQYHDLGFRFVGCGSDGTFVNSGARRTLTALKGMLKGNDPT